ncbi:MAG: PH domain-containing protein [Promethearchaeota archaeon]
MEKKVNAMVISIPEDSRAKTEPRIFRPVNRFKTKLYLYELTIYFIVGIGIGAFYAFMTWVLEENANSGEDAPFFLKPDFIPTAFILYIITGFTIMVLSLIFVPKYVNGILYQVHGTEVVVIKGLLNKTEKHVPFRTITNISSRAGIYDRLLGIGNVNIETAGKSGTSRAPEEKIEGIRVYKEVRDFILKELRKFRTPYTTTTEVEEERISPLSDSRELINELREIKEILIELSKKKEESV